MNPISIVVARARNLVIGNANAIPWHATGEQRLFRDITMGGVLVMGRKTFESIGRPLPGRETVIISRNPGFSIDGCTTAGSLQAGLEQAQAHQKPIHIVGGGQIYQQALPLVDVVHLTTVQVSVEGDTLFDHFPTAEFTLEREHYFESNIDYLYQRYRRV